MREPEVQIGNSGLGVCAEGTLQSMFSSPILPEPHSGGVSCRRSPRQRIERLVYADFGPGNGGFAINLSEGGIAFQGIRPLQKNEIIRVKFKLPATNDTVETTGQVVWLNELGKGGGLQFIDLPEELRHPIIHWMSLQTKPNNRGESMPVGARQVEKKETHPLPPLPPEAQLAIAASKVETNSIAPSPPSVVSPRRVTDAALRSDLTAEPFNPTDTSQAKLPGAGAKPTWIMPFTIGVISSAAIIIAIMYILGVISVQFRLPQKTSGENPAPSVTGSGVANAPESPSEKTLIDKSATNRSTPGRAALRVPSATRTRVPYVGHVPPELQLPELSTAITATSIKFIGAVVLMFVLVILGATGGRVMSDQRNRSLKRIVGWALIVIAVGALRYLLSGNMP
jgi:hypothetical protein